MTIGDARIAVTIRRDEDTIKLKRGQRFLIDDPDSDVPLAYQITKSNKLFNVFNGEGVYRFILTEVESTKNDNIELRIADYYNWAPTAALDSDHVDSDETLNEIVASATAEANTQPDDDKEVWI